MQQAIELFGKTTGHYRELAESVLAYCNLGAVKYPDCPEWTALRDVCTENMARLSVLIDESAKEPIPDDNFTTRADVAYENYTDRVLTGQNL